MQEERRNKRIFVDADILYQMPTVLAAVCQLADSAWAHHLILYFNIAIAPAGVGYLV